MKRGNEESIYNFLSRMVKMYIPIYQRGYGWREEDREYFWSFVEKLDLNNQKRTHYCHAILTEEFVNGKIYVENQSEAVGLVDGQQRTITSSLIYTAICSFCKEHDVDFDWENKIYNEVLVSPKNNFKIKLELKEEDNETYRMLVEDLPATPVNKNAGSTTIIESYNFFLKKLTLDNVIDIYNKFNRFTIGNDVIEEHDSAQVIFETINFGGTHLKDYEVIRSYTLLGYSREKQRELYYKYWQPIISYFNNGNNTEQLHYFIKGYICYKTNQLEFAPKAIQFVQDCEDMNMPKEELLKDITIYFNKFKRIYGQCTDDLSVDSSLRMILGINSVFTPQLIMPIYDRYLDGRIDFKEWKSCISLIESLMVRGKIINSKETMRKFRKAFNVMSYPDNNCFKRIYDVANKAEMFYSDVYLKEVLLEVDLYDILKSKNTFLFLEKLENYYYPKGWININNTYSVEHIMPQKIKDTDWTIVLGKHWRKLHRKYKGNLGNLTLTAYNSEYSQLLFEEKKTMEHGFNDDPLNLNKKSVVKWNHWNEDSIIQRCKELSEITCEVFSYPYFEKKEGVKQSTLMEGK